MITFEPAYSQTPDIGKLRREKPSRYQQSRLLEVGLLTKFAFDPLKQDFPDENMNWHFVRKQMVCYRQQIEQSVLTVRVEWGWNRDWCGRRAIIKFTSDVAQPLIEALRAAVIQALRLETSRHGYIDVTPMTVRN